jgi:hypothetical protein
VARSGTLAGWGASATKWQRATRQVAEEAEAEEEAAEEEAAEEEAVEEDSE